MRRTPTKQKLHPPRLLMLLLYHDYGFATWTGDRVELVVGNLARIFRVSRGRVYDYVEWLAKFGYVTDVERPTRGRVSFTVRRPKRWLADP